MNWLTQYSGSTWDAQESEKISLTARAGDIFRSAATTLMGRADFASRTGLSFRGLRDMFRALGYDRTLTAVKYRERYERGGIVGRFNDIYPKATWRGGGEIVEDQDPDISTPFEQAWKDLNQRLNVWQVFEQADILAGLGKFAVIFIGAPGNFTEPLQTVGSTGISYLMAYSERDVVIENLDIDPRSPRYGLPVFYNISRMTAPLEAIQSAQQRRVHHSRVIHIADGKLDDRIFGQPRLRRIWNLLDDLDKIVGGGAEAFWKRVDAGLHIKQDPTIGKMSDADKKAFDEMLENYVDGLERVIRTRGIDIQTLSSNVANFDANVASVIGLLCGAMGIPQRIFLGSERGELASGQDRDEWSERVHDRRVQYAGPEIVRPFITRMIELNVLPKPQEFEPRWPSLKELDDIQRMDLAQKAANVNNTQGEIVIPTNEIRDRYLDLPPLDEVLAPEEIKARSQNKTLPRAAIRAAKWRVLTVDEKRAYLARAAAKKRRSYPTADRRVGDRFRRAGREDMVERIS